MPRIALVVLGLAAGGAAELAQAAPTGPPLGRGHAWLKLGRTDLDDQAGGAWGVDRERHLALEVYGHLGQGFYFGGEIGRVAVGRATTSGGETLRDFDFIWLELNEKAAFDLKHGLSLDAGVGASLFYADGEEVEILGGQESTSPLADVGFGAQIFGDFNWRSRRFLIGLDAKYQWAFDIIDVDYSNLRLGAHMGIAF